MPRSKHRRKGKIRPRVAHPSDPRPGGLYFGDLRDDDERDPDELDPEEAALFDQAMQQALDEFEEQFGDEEPDYGFAYDPSVDPDPQAWLALDETVRILVVDQAHRDVDFGEEASARVHAITHVIVENDIAEAGRPTRAVLERLQREGLDRHEAVHAIGSILLLHINEMLAKATGDQAFYDRTYRAALEKLTAETWRRDFGADGEDAQ